MIAQAILQPVEIRRISQSVSFIRLGTDVILSLQSTYVFAADERQF